MSKGIMTTVSHKVATNRVKGRALENGKFHKKNDIVWGIHRVSMNQDVLQVPIDEYQSYSVAVELIK